VPLPSHRRNIATISAETTINISQPPNTTYFRFHTGLVVTLDTRRLLLAPFTPIGHYPTFPPSTHTAPHNRRNTTSPPTRLSLPDSRYPTLARTSLLLLSQPYLNTSHSGHFRHTTHFHGPKAHGTRHSWVAFHALRPGAQP